MKPSPACPLCSFTATTFYFKNEHYRYFICPRCDLVFMDPRQRLAPEEEQQRYDLHQNNPDNSGYRQFLELLFQPVLERLQPEAAGLDFGSGPHPLLPELFRQAGHSIQLYDPYYATDPAPFHRSYNFITACEVVEHLYHPGPKLDLLWQLLKPSGILGIMTGLRHPQISFATWHYISDPTHVIFCSPVTCTWLQQHWQADLEFIHPNVVLFRKGP